MINIDGKVYRNLEEQVRKNKEDIAKHWEITDVLADFGIKILGTLSDPQDIPERSSSDESYGDAYLIGSEAPFDVYIWTRPNPDLGIYQAYWLNIGPIAIQGPEGPEGPEGPQGEPGRSSNWIIGNNPPIPSAGLIGDIWLTLTGSSKGNVYSKGSGGWIQSGNILGPQGPQGLQGMPGPQGPEGPQGAAGPQGDPATQIEIFGSLTSINQLPTVESVPRNAGYLIPNPTTSFPHLWILVPENPGSPGILTWSDAGPYAAGGVISYDEMSNNRGFYKLSPGAYFITKQSGKLQATLYKNSTSERLIDDDGNEARAFDAALIFLPTPWAYNYRWGTNFSQLGPTILLMICISGTGSIFNTSVSIQRLKLSDPNISLGLTDMTDQTTWIGSYNIIRFT